MSERQGVEIDYCPQCRGVWLDRGELDKLVALSARADTAPAAAAPARGAAAPARGAAPPFADSDFRHGSQRGYKRHKSWLSEIFD
jgi:Zn-finger nucleic acid-binding protein